MKKIVVIGVLVIVIAIAVAAGSSGGDSSDANPSVTSAPPVTAPPSVKTKTTDVRITSCGVDSIGWPSAKVEITNTHGGDRNYMATVEFVDKTGVRIGEGLVATNNLRSGQKYVGTAQGFAEATHGVACRLTDTTSYPSF